MSKQAIDNTIADVIRRAEVFGMSPEKLLDGVVLGLYESYKRSLTPKFPWVAVRVLRREQKIGGIVLPEAQNKTALEGVVLAVWAPFKPTRVSLDALFAKLYDESGLIPPTDEEDERTIDIVERVRRYIEKNVGHIPPFYNINFTAEEGWQHQEKIASELKPGDHVLFPAWAGMPIDGYDKAYFRFVKECNWSVDKEGGIFAGVDYEGKGASIAEKLMAVIRGEFQPPVAYQAAERVLQQFVVIDRDEDSATLSGR